MDVAPLKTIIMKKLVCLFFVVSMAFATAFAQIKPHITSKTVRVAVPEDTDINSVSEGVVTLVSDYKLAFYNIGTQKFFGDFKYDYIGNISNNQVFSGGVIAVSTEVPKEGSYGTTKYFHIVDVNGHEKKFGQDVYRNIWPFVDGVAKAWKPTSSWSSLPVFIDKNGKEVLGDVLKGKDPYDWDARPLQDGRRAVYVDRWGYVDAAGKVVIEPKYRKATNFSEGYALVSTDGDKFGIIDKNGKMVVPESIEAGWELPRDFHCGWAYLPSKEVFVDTKGKLSPSVKAVTDFYNGVAIVETGWNEFAIMDSKSFSVIKQIKTDLSPKVMNNAPGHFIEGLYLLDAYGGNYVLDTAGNIVLKADGNCEFTGIWDGALLSLLWDSVEGLSYDHESVAVCDSKGEILVIFDRKGKFTAVKEAKAREDEGGEVGGEPEPEPQPEPIPPVPPQPTPPEPTPPKPGPGDKGGNNGGTIGEPGNDPNVNRLKSIVIVYDEPFDGTRKADVYSNIEIGGAFQRGDSLKVGVIPADKKASTVKASVKCGSSKVKSMTLAGPGLWVAKLTSGEATVEVHVGIPEEPEIPEKWVLGGHRDFSQLMDGEVKNMEADIYIMTDPDGIKGTPLGDDVKGLFVVDFDPKQRFTTYFNDDKSKPLNDFATYFWGPSKIEGFYEVNGTKYIYMNGGPHVVGNWMKYGEGDLGGLLISLLMSLAKNNMEQTDGDPTYVVLMLPHRYRLSYTSLPDGGMTLGLLERFSQEYGWVPSNDKRLIKKTHHDHGFMSITEQSEVPVEPDILKGVELHKAPKPSALPAFYPGRNWFTDDTHYNHTVDNFNKMYGVTGAGEHPFTQEEHLKFILNILERWQMRKVE